MKRFALLFVAVAISIQAAGCGGADTSAASNPPPDAPTATTQPNTKAARGAAKVINPANPNGPKKEH